jgi:adenylylsulfate kinase-like enzyme
MVTGRDPKLADPAIQEVQAIEAQQRISATDRQKRVGHASVLIWLNGGVHLAYSIESELFRRGYLTHVIAAQTDGSMMLELAQNLTAAGLVTICAADFLYETERDRAQAVIDPARFLDVDASLFSSPEEAVEKISVMMAQRRISPVDE